MKIKFAIIMFLAIFTLSGCACIQKAKRQLGYNPKVSFRDGILETVEWFKTL